VRDIFQLYLSGLSYSRIASEMERRGIKYHQHTNQWNKHMVKRILENDTYLGGGQYPQLISTDELQAVRLQRDGKATPSSRPAEIGPVREKAVCACCGAKMLRDTKAKGRPRWSCTNDDCGLTVYGEDTQVLEALGHRLRQLAAAPQLLTLPMPQREESPDGARIRNELTLALNRAEENGELIRMLIFAAAAESYSVLPDMTLHRRIAGLRERLEEGQMDDSMLWELMDAAVKSVRIGKGCEVSLELINGRTVEEHNREEMPA